MYSPKIFRKNLSKQLCFLTPLDGFSCNAISNNVKAKWSLKCWLYTFCEILCSTFKYLYLRMMVPFLPCIYVTLSSDPPPKKKYVEHCCLLRFWKVLFHILLESELEIPWCKMAGYVKHWKVEHFLPSQPSLTYDKWNISD